MDDFPNCPKCSCEYTYEDGNLFICPECGHEWSKYSEKENVKEEGAEAVIKDAVGNILSDGDSVTIIKDTKVKGSSSSLKAGTKVKNIRLVEEVNGHNIDAKVPGIGPLMLKSSIVKKSN